MSCKKKNAFLVIYAHQPCLKISITFENDYWLVLDTVKSDALLTACLCCPSQSYNCVITECYWLPFSLKAHIRLHIEIAAFCVRPMPRLMLFVSHLGISLVPFYSWCFYLQRFFVVFVRGFFFPFSLTETLNETLTDFRILENCRLYTVSGRQQEWPRSYRCISVCYLTSWFIFKDVRLTVALVLSHLLTSEFVKWISFFTTLNEWATGGSTPMLRPHSVLEWETCFVPGNKTLCFLSVWSKWKLAAQGAFSVELVKYVSAVINFTKYGTDILSSATYKRTFLFLLLFF